MKSLILTGEKATGWNRLFGEPRYRWDFLSPPLDLAGVTTLGIYNPDGDQPLPITKNTPKDAILATIVDPMLETVFPPFTVDLADPSGINVPLREVGTWTTGDLSGRTALPAHLDAPFVSRSQAAPKAPTPISLGNWFQATGKLKIRSYGDGGARLSLKVKDLIPNRVYTVWAMWHTAERRIFPQPFGGAPNAYITDGDGDALFERELNFCPIKAAQEGIEGNRLLSIITHLHSDHILYGSVPVPLFGGFPPGTVLHMALEWNFPGVGQRLID